MLAGSKVTSNYDSPPSDQIDINKLFLIFFLLGGRGGGAFCVVYSKTINRFRFAGGQHYSPSLRLIIIKYRLYTVSSRQFGKQTSATGLFIACWQTCCLNKWLISLMTYCPDEKIWRKLTDWPDNWLTNWLIIKVIQVDNAEISSLLDLRIW